jgi:hypothetical protein
MDVLLEIPEVCFLSFCSRHTLWCSNATFDHALTTRHHMASCCFSDKRRPFDTYFLMWLLPCAGRA